MTPSFWPDAPPGRDDLQIQVPHTIIAAMNETIAVPDGSSVLLRIARTRAPANPDAAPLDPVYLLVRPTILKPLSATPAADDDAT